MEDSSAVDDVEARTRTIMSVRLLLESGRLGRVSGRLALAGVTRRTRRGVAWGPKLQRGPGLRGHRLRSRDG